MITTNFTLPQILHSLSLREEISKNILYRYWTQDAKSMFHGWVYIGHYTTAILLHSFSIGTY